MPPADNKINFQAVNCDCPGIADKAGFLCVCGAFVVAFINGSPQVFLLNDIEEITFQGKDSLGIGKSPARNQG